MSPNRVYFGFFLAVFAAVAVIIILFRMQKNPASQVKTFEDCAKAGYPVMQSYPRQCTLPGGKFFVEQVVRER